MILLRYPSWLRPVLLGSCPLIVTGKKFSDVSCEGRGRRPFWRMLPGFVEELYSAGVKLNGDDPALSREVLAELMLSQEIAQAVWVTHTDVENILPDPGLRQRICVETMAREAPVGFHTDNDPVGDILELLDGMSPLEYYRSLFGQHDRVTFEQQQITV